MIKRGMAYWDIFRDYSGAERKYPVLVVSNDIYNENMRYVQTLRITVKDRWPSTVHLNVPREAWNRASELGECVILGDTISATRVSDLYGPIAEIRPEWMAKVDEIMKMQLGMKPLPVVPSEIVDSMMKNAENTIREVKERPIYTASMGPQMRNTYPEPRPRTPTANRYEVNLTGTKDQSMLQRFMDLRSAEGGE